MNLTLSPDKKDDSLTGSPRLCLRGIETPKSKKIKYNKKIKRITLFSHYTKDKPIQISNDSPKCRQPKKSKTPKNITIKLFSDNKPLLSKYNYNEDFQRNNNHQFSFYQANLSPLIKTYKNNHRTINYMRSNTIHHSLRYNKSSMTNKSSFYIPNQDELSYCHLKLNKKPPVPERKPLFTKKETIILKHLDRTLPEHNSNTSLHLKQELIEHCAERNNQPKSIQDCFHSMSKILEFRKRSRLKAMSTRPNQIYNNTTINSSLTRTIDEEYTIINNTNQSVENTQSTLTTSKLNVNSNDNSSNLFHKFRPTKSRAVTYLKPRALLIKKSLESHEDSYHKETNIERKAKIKANKIADSIGNIASEYDFSNKDREGFSENNLNRVIILKQIQKGFFGGELLNKLNNKKLRKFNEDKKLLTLSRLGPPKYLKNRFKLNTIFKFKQKTGLFMGTSQKFNIENA